MPASNRPELFVFMDAYKVLGVDYSANSSEIRRAHRRLAKLHHPDRCPAGSPEQQQATARMAEINNAYHLVREAPLRYHRVSKASDPDRAWTDSELDEAIRRSQLDRIVDRAMSIALAVVAMVLVPLLVSSTMPSVASAGPLGIPVVVALTLGSSWVMWAVLGPRMWRTLYKIQLALAIVQVLTRYW